MITGCLTSLGLSVWQIFVFKEMPQENAILNLWCLLSSICLITSVWMWRKDADADREQHAKLNTPRGEIREIPYEVAGEI